MAANEALKAGADNAAVHYLFCPKTKAGSAIERVSDQHRAHQPDGIGN